MTAMRKRLDVGGIVLGMAMLGLLASFPEKGWVACIGLAFALAFVWGASGSLRGIAAPGALSLLVLMSLASLAVSLAPAVALSQLWLFWGCIGAFCLICLWARTRARLVWTGAGLAAVAVALSLAAPFAVNWFTERKTFLPPAIYESFPRLVADPIHPNVMASLMVGLLFLPLVWTVAPPQIGLRPHWVSRALGSRLLWAVAVCLPAIVLLLTKSRGGYAGAAIGLALLVLLVARRKRGLFLVLLGVVAAVLVLALWIPGNAPLADLGEGDALNAETLAFRQRLWHYALLLIGDFPFTGVGMRAFNGALASVYGYAVTTDPGAHSLFMQVALDLGIPGLLAFGALLALVLFRSFRACAMLKRAGDPLWLLAVGGLAGVAATLAQGLVDIAAWGTRGSFVLWCLLGMLAALSTYAQTRSDVSAGRTGRAPNTESTGHPLSHPQ